MYKITVFLFKLPSNVAVPNINPDLRANANLIQNVHCYERVKHKVCDLRCGCCLSISDFKLKNLRFT